MVKIDTKQDFFIFQLEEADITEKMSVLLKNELLKIKEEKPGNIILKIPKARKKRLSTSFSEDLKQIQSDFLEQELSFLLTSIDDQSIRKQLKEDEINFTPTLAEAIDIVMMEKLERDLLEDE